MITFATSKNKKSMQTNSLLKTSTIRFRRWSRVGYAVFSSLKSNISIGSLSISVSDKTLQKSNNVISEKQNLNSSKSDEKEELELEFELQQIQNITLSEIAFDNLAACGLIPSYIINYNG